MQKNYEQMERFIDILAEHILFSKKGILRNYSTLSTYCFNNKLFTPRA